MSLSSPPTADRPLPTIAYIAGQFPLRSETFVYREVRELRRRGWNVVCVTLHAPTDVPEDADDLVKDRITVYDALLPRLLRGRKWNPWHALFNRSIESVAWGDALVPLEPTSWKSRLKLLPQQSAAAALVPRLRARGVTHIHCHFAHAPTTIGMYAAMEMGIPFSFTGHANDLFQRRALLKRKLRRASFVACISEEHRKLYCSIEPKRDVKYPIIRCGVDTDAFSAEMVDPIAKAAAEDADAFLKTPTTAPLKILIVCRLVEKKGVDTLIRALAPLRQRRDWRLIVAGDGPQRAGLEALAAAGNIAERVTFLGPVANDRVRKLLRETDLFALPCRVDRNGDKDGIPVVLMEAMASGVPVISGDLPAIRELVIDGETGVLVDGAKAEDTTFAIQRLLDDAALRSRLGIRGRARVLDEFSLAKNVDRLEAALSV